MNKNQALKEACQILKRRVRFERAEIYDKNSQVVTQQVRDQTKVYVETWIVPLLDYIEKGDYWSIKQRVISEKRQTRGNGK